MAAIVLSERQHAATQAPDLPQLLADFWQRLKARHERGEISERTYCRASAVVFIFYGACMMEQGRPMGALLSGLGTYILSRT